MNGEKRYCALLLIIASLVCAAQSECTRRYSSGDPDCSAARHEDGRLAASHAPCLVKGGEDVPVQQLEFPEEK
jgi:hypothetical protein